MPTSKPKTDKRLLGAWRSDRRRTMKDWVWPLGQSAEKRKKRIRFAALFGHLTLRYTRTHIHAELQDSKWALEYDVVAADSVSVAITSWDSLNEEVRITHIHFEGDSSWILILDGSQREWFKKVKKRRKPTRA